MNDNDQGIAEVVRLVSQGESLSAIVEAISAMFDHCPVTLIDETFGILAASANYAEVLPEFKEDVEQGYIGLAAQYDLARSTVARPLGKRSRPVVHQVHLGGHTINNYFTLIYAKYEAIGSFSVFARDGELSKEQVEFLPMLASLLSIALRDIGGTRAPTKEDPCSTLLRNLARNSSFASMTEADARKRFALYGYDLKKWKCVVYFDMSRAAMNERELVRQAETFVRDLKDTSTYYIDGSDIVAFRSSSSMMSSHALSEDAFKKWERTAGGDTTICAGISDIFDDIADLRKAIAQARHTAHLVPQIRPDRTVLCYDDCRTFDLFHHIQEDVDLSDFYYPALMRVFKYDEERGTELARTLYEYFKNPRRIPDLCERLGIHRNTLYYRLNNIAEIMGGKDIHAAEASEQIQLTFAMMTYEGKLIFPGDKAKGE